jgi:hypothetical protein
MRYLPLLLLIGCGSGTVELAASGYEERDVEGLTPAAGNRAVVVEVTLTNETGGTIPLGPEQFFLEASSGPSVSGHPITTSTGGGCGSAGDSLAPDRDVTCEVVFDIASSFDAELVVYENDGRRATAALPALETTDGGMDAGPPDAGGPSDGGPPDAGPAPSTEQLDLLFMIDNSNSMVEEQASLSAEIPEMIRILTTGDLSGDGTAELDPIEDIQVGVITSDMGTGGHVAPTCGAGEFAYMFGDDGLLRTAGNPDDATCQANYPSILDFDPTSGTPADFARDVQCLAVQGNGGCGFEQQLEAILKALSPRVANAGVALDFIPIGTLGAPAGLDLPFFGDTQPHGDTANARFVRPGSVLAIVPLTDEEDCSAIDLQLFNVSGGPYTGTDLNLRCFAFPAAQHPVSRYVRGLRQLRPFASRLVYAPIVGIPVDLAPETAQSPDYDALISEDLSIRDDRMEPRPLASDPNRLTPSCDTPGRGVAFPPVRIVQVARGLEEAGARVTVQSICQSDFTGVLIEVVRRIYLALGGAT